MDPVLVHECGLGVKTLSFFLQGGTHMSISGSHPTQGGQSPSAVGLDIFTLSQYESGNDASNLVLESNFNSSWGLSNT